LIPDQRRRSENPCTFDERGLDNAARAQVLLKREIPIDREKRLEALGNHERQKFTVALGRPTQIDDVVCVVASQIT
jgi:hypothetical protein